MPRRNTGGHARKRASIFAKPGTLKGAISWLASVLELENPLERATKNYFRDVTWIEGEQVIRTVAFRLTAMYLQVNSTAVTTSEVSEVHRLSPRLWSPNLPLVVLPNCLKALNITAGECALYANIYDNDDGKVTETAIGRHHRWINKSLRFISIESSVPWIA